MKKMYFPRRIFVVIGTFSLSLLLYIDRACISAAKDDITFDLNLDSTEFGWIMAMFTLGYAILQTPSGLLADRKGSRNVIAGIVSAWSILTALTGAAWNYISMLVIRFLFGAGEAGAFPSMSKVIFNWFPIKERGIVQGMNFSGSRLGAAFAMPMVAYLISQFQWRTTFLILGIVGVLFGIVWYVFFTNKPEESKNISQTELDYILEHRQKPSEGNAQVLSANKLFGSKNMWFAMIQYIASNFTFYFALAWMYPYLKERFALSGMEAGWFAMVPLIAGAGGNWFSGLLVDAIYKKGHWKFSRQIPAVLGFILAALGMALLAIIHASPGLSIVFLSIAIFGADMTLSPSWAFCIDIGKENAGTISGTMNMAGNLGAFVTIIAFPYLLEWTGMHEPFFYVCCSLSAIGIIMWGLMKPEKGIISK